MQPQHKNDPFTQYQLHIYQPQLACLPPLDPKQLTTSLIEGCILRYKMKLYPGEEAYTKDLQTVLNLNPDIATPILKSFQIQYTSLPHPQILSQCQDCGRYQPIYSFCLACHNIHYCSQTCQIRHKLSHQTVCHPRQTPGKDVALQVEVHVGGDLGRDVEVYVQNGMRFSLRRRGEKWVGKVFQWFGTGGGKGKIREDYSMEIVNGHLKVKKIHQGQSTANKQAPFIPQSLDSLCQIYHNNPVLAQLTLFTLSHGGILTHRICQLHNNHFHLIYIFLLP